MADDSEVVPDSRRHALIKRSVISCLRSKAFDEDAAGTSAGFISADGSIVCWLYFHFAPTQICAIHAFHCCLQADT